MKIVEILRDHEDYAIGTRHVVEDGVAEDLSRQFICRIVEDAPAEEPPPETPAEAPAEAAAPKPARQRRDAAESRESND